jgi:hypothetical protein
MSQESGAGGRRRKSQDREHCNLLESPGASIRTCLTLVTTADLTHGGESFSLGVPGVEMCLGPSYGPKGHDSIARGKPWAMLFWPLGHRKAPKFSRLFLAIVPKIVHSYSSSLGFFGGWSNRRSHPRTLVALFHILVEQVKIVPIP